MTHFQARVPRIRLAAVAPLCDLCGSDEIASDEAFDRGLWLLGECGRCGHRWTVGPFDGPTPAPARVRPLPVTPEEGVVAA